MIWTDRQSISLSWLPALLKWILCFSISNCTNEANMLSRHPHACFSTTIAFTTSRCPPKSVDRCWFTSVKTKPANWLDRLTEKYFLLKLKNTYGSAWMLATRWIPLTAAEGSEAFTAAVNTTCQRSIFFRPNQSTLANRVLKPRKDKGAKVR